MEAERKQSIFLTDIGASIYKLLQSLVSPHKWGEKTLEELMTALKQHFDPTPSEIVQQYKFNSCYRQPTETIATFTSELHSLAEICNYGASLDECYEIINNSIQCWLFAKTNCQRPLR